jgi:plasmid replication initiation protein
MTEDLPIQSELFPEDTHRDHQKLMAHPFAAFSKDLSEIAFKRTFSDGRTLRLMVTSGVYGMATIHDFDVVLYVISGIRQAMNDGEEPPRTVTFTPRQFLKWTDRGTGGRAYDNLYDALERLATTSVKTTLSEGSGRRENLEPWLAWTIMLREDREQLRRNDRVTVRLNSWLWKSVVEKDLLLATDRQYFGLRSSYERFLYRVFRKSVGQGNHWAWKMATLYDRAGTEVRPSRFAYYVRKYAQKDRLPGLRLSIFEGPDAEWVRAYDRTFWEDCLDMDSGTKAPPPPWQSRGG